MKFTYEPPEKRWNPFTETDEAFSYIEGLCLEAERQNPGKDLQKGHERLTAVATAAYKHFDLPTGAGVDTYLYAKLFVKTVYTSIARQIDPSLRASKVPSPERR